MLYQYIAEKANSEDGLIKRLSAEHILAQHCIDIYLYLFNVGTNITFPKLNKITLSKPVMI